jgi:hypothetical protein
MPPTDSPTGPVRLLTAADAEAFVALRAAALAAEPLHFGASAHTDRFRDPAAARELLARGAAAPVFGAFDGGALVGCVGLVRVDAPKAAHRATVWGMYVAPSQRGRGTGAALLAAAVEHARGWSGVDWVQLDVSAVAPAAVRLYERCGFVAWGREPDGLRADGRSTDVLHMARRLEP